MKKFKELSNAEMQTIKGGVTIISEGTDAGGHFVIMDTGYSCEKRYVISGGGNGQFDH